MTNEKKILASWKRNVTPWERVIRNREIESRRLVTDRAIVDAVCALPGRTLLDIGCGEGWLVRELAGRGWDATGVDAVEAFIDIARHRGGGSYLTMAYDQLSADALPGGYDVGVCNFSLLGRESVEHLFRVIGSVLNPGGFLVVQTLHPHSACGALPYRDGWREGSWEGFPGDFSDPAPWYFRTLESWQKLFQDNGLTIHRCLEPGCPATARPLSLLLTGESCRH